MTEDGMVFIEKLQALKELFEARFEALKNEQVLRDQALNLAREAIDHRLAGMNEFREQMAKTEATYLRVSDFQREHSSVIQRLESEIRLLETKLEEQEKITQAKFEAVAQDTTQKFLWLSRAQWMFAGGLTAIVFLVGILEHWHK